MLITGSLDKGIKIFQLPFYWPSELVRKYKSKNDKKILLSNINYIEDKNTGEEEFEKALEKLENDEVKNKNPFENENDKKSEKINKEENLKNNNDKEENKLDDNIETTEDEDFLILRSVAKLKHELSENEKNCEDLHGWDEDF